MNYACDVAVMEEANFDDGVALIDRVIKQAQLRRTSDFVSRVFLLGTPHFSKLIEDLSHMCIARTNCLNIWGGCVSGLLHNKTVYGHKPALLVAIFGKAFEPASGHGPNSHTLSLQLAENDQKIVEKIRTGLLEEPQQAVLKANELGLLSYGANYANMPRIEHGRLTRHPVACTSLNVSNSLTLNSEGLEFFTEPLTVTESNGLFLIQVNNQSAAVALQSPQEQTRPVGLRLQVINEDGESWIPVLAVHADGTVCLVAPVAKGQKVRLARRTPQAVREEMKHWKPHIDTHFHNKPPQMGLLMAGFERSEMCHSIDDDVAQVLEAFPETEMIGIFGQACWLGAEDDILTPPRNNRLCLSLFNPNLQ